MTDHAGRIAIPLPFTVAANSSPYFAQAARIGARHGFYRDGTHASVVFRAGSPRLLVSFCNLASFEHDRAQRLPWLARHAEQRGWSHLGVMAHRKDWYRNAGTPDLLNDLAEAGFFERFERVLFSGTSMGGFAALVYSSFAAGSDVLAFSPQSTLSTAIAPFEGRYRWPRRKFDWTDPDYLDAADYVGRACRVAVVYDPMLPEDKAHALRLRARGADLVACRFMGHQTPNSLKRASVLDPLVDTMMDGAFDRSRFYRAFRAGRRRMVDWRKSLVRHAMDGQNPDRARVVCRATVRDLGGPWFRQALARLDAMPAGAEA